MRWPRRRPARGPLDDWRPPPPSTPDPLDPFLDAADAVNGHLSPGEDAVIEQARATLRDSCRNAHVDIGDPDQARAILFGIALGEEIADAPERRALIAHLIAGSLRP